MRHSVIDHNKPPTQYPTSSRANPAAKVGSLLRRIFLVLAGTLALTLLASQLRGQEVSLPIGTQGPAAALEDLEGNPVDLLDFVEEGKPALIEFWASWCRPCKHFAPTLDELASEFANPLEFGPGVTMMAASLLVFGLVRGSRLSPSRVIATGLTFQVVISFCIPISQYYGAFAKGFNDLRYFDHPKFGVVARVDRRKDLHDDRRLGGHDSRPA